MASVRIGSADGVALLASAVRNTLKLFSAQWRFTTALCCDACAFLQVGLLLFPPPCPALRPCCVVLLLAARLWNT